MHDGVTCGQEKKGKKTIIDGRRAMKGCPLSPAVASPAPVTYATALNDAHSKYISRNHATSTLAKSYAS